MEKPTEESLFIDLEAYKGQDDRQAKSLGTQVCSNQVTISWDKER